MPTYKIKKNGKIYSITRDNKEEAIAAVLAHVGESPVNEDLPDVPTTEEGLRQREREMLEAQLERDKQGMAEANRNLAAAEDSLWDNLKEGVGKAAATTNEMALMGADMLTAAPRIPYNYGIQPLLQEMGVDAPKVNSIMDVMGDYDPRKVQGPEEGYANMAAQGAGMAPIAAAAMAPRAVQGAMGAGDVALDLLGVGSTEARLVGTTAKEQARAYGLAAESMDNRVLRDPNAPNAARRDLTQQYDFSEDKGVWQAANDINDELTFESNRVALGEYDKVSSKIAKQEAKLEKAKPGGKGEAKAQAKLDELNAKVPDYDPTVRINQTLDILEERYGLNRLEAYEQIQREGGFMPAKGFQEINERVAAANKMDYDGDGTVPGWFARTIRPASALMQEKVGRVFGSKFERAFETATRKNELVTTKYLSQDANLDSLTKWSDSPEVKAMFLDLRGSGVEGRNQIIAKAANELGAKEANLLREMFEDANKHQREARSLYRKGTQTDEVFWPSNKLSQEDEKMKAFQAEESRPTGVTGAQARARKRGSEMEAEELATYETPITALITRMTQERTLMELGKQYQLPPSLARGDNTRAFFDALEAKVARESGNADKAKIARGIAEQTFEGTRKRPPKGVEMFMKQSYAGTLGQLDSAILNMHDIAVSMMRNGTVPTMKAMVSKGFDIQQLGITNSTKSMGEFQEGFNGFAQRGKLEKAVDWYQDKAFGLSGFRALDRFGKGTVLQAGWNMAQASAKKGKLIDDFSYLMKPQELAQIQNVLKNGTPLEKMTDKQRELVTQLMFARLGEQQLISAAGRPLAYLKNPKFRWAYAMTGFAIKQAEMMKKGVLDNINKGNYKAAGEFAYRYMMFAGVGYGLVNQARGSIQGALGNEDKEPSLEGFAMDVLSQPVSAVTFNRLGDSYSWNEFKKDPVDAALSSFVPPTGLLGNIAKDFMSIFSENGIRMETLKSIPGGDELLALLKEE